MMTIGKKLKAINTCKMNSTQEESLIIGKEYEVINILDSEGETCVVIIDEQNEEHDFPIAEIRNWFN
jgi:hypothetical protein